MTSARRALARVTVFTFAVSLAVATVVPGTASADLSTADCQTRLAGHPFGQGRTVRLPHDKPATISVSTFEQQPRYRVELGLAGVYSDVGSGRGTDFGWSRILDVGGNSWLGVGLYRLRVTTYVGGQPCVAEGLMNVTGRAPLTTASGALAGLLLLVGAAAIVTTVLRTGGRPLSTRRAFGADNSFEQLATVDTPGEYVGWAEVACDVGARTFVTATPSTDSLRAFLREDTTRTRLRDLHARGVAVRDDSALLPRLRWRPRVYVVAPLLAGLGGIGLVEYMQQAGIAYPTPARVAVTTAAAVVVGELAANLARRIGVRRLNKRLKGAEAGLDTEVVEPRYPPLDHLDELDTFVWTPTHVVPDSGLPAWNSPDRNGGEPAALDPGLPVKVVERRDGLAQIVCSNGWVGWTDSEALEELTS